MGIGASAGGLESLEQLFSALPPDTGMAFVVVQHLSPDFRSMMDELISRYSEMPVVLAQDGMPLRANHIFLLPPRKEMIVRERRLVLTERDPHTFSLPIDTFFRSLAMDAGARAVAVVLSGSGSDGSRGATDVHNAGGTVLAETPTSARFDGMPLSVLATGCVDQSHPPGDLARVLCGLPPAAPLADAEPALSDDPEMDGVFRLLRDQFGIDFSLYKITTVGRRIQRRLDLLRIGSMSEYLAQLRVEPDELNALYQDLLIGVTQFFRDPPAFSQLETEVIPKLLDGIANEEEVRLWIAGCGTGEEAYSVAMLFLEALERSGRPINVKILATDVHQQSLDVASAGIYGEEQLTNVSHSRMARFFTRRSSGFQISQELRQMIVFARHNVTKDAPFTKMHFISCRNMLIYFQPHAQRAVLSLFHFGLATGGVLFLGASETPGQLADEFVTIDDHWKIYRKRRDVHLLNHARLPANRQSRRPSSVDVTRRLGADPLMLQTYDQLLDRFMPPGFLIDEERILVDSFAGAEKILRLRRRRPSTNILDLLDDELRSVVAGAIQRAFKELKRISYSGVRIPTETGEIRCTVVAEPMVHPRTNVRHVLLTFPDFGNEEASTRPPPEPVAADAPSTIPAAMANKERLDGLEAELTYTKETLQATIEELETSNEEMQATNEELVASNEELQSTNEELHSVNEELYTVNAEYQQKIQELKELNTDMAHLLEGTDVGTVFLDSDLRIRRFTSQIAGVFRFQKYDVGREIRDFSHNIVRPALMDEIEQVRRKGNLIEDEVRDRDGKPFFLRILPYRVKHQDNGREQSEIAGVVLTLTDTSALDRARSRLRQLAAIIQSSDDAIVGANLDGTITAWNRGAEQTFGYSAEEIVGQSIGTLMASDAAAGLAELLARIERGERIEHLGALCRHKDGRLLDVSTTVSTVSDDSGTIAGFSAIGRDIAPLAAARRELEERQERIEALLEQTAEGARRREQFLAMLSHELRNPLAAVMNASTLLERRPAPDVFARCCSVIDRQAQHMKRLLDDLLDVSRITRGKFELRLQKMDLRQAIEAAIESVQPLYDERGMKLVTSLPERPMPMQGDANRLMQVAVNLLSNAANYSPRNTEVRLVVTVEAGNAVMRVIDHGIGIEAELQEKIFELFVQSEQRLDRSHGGLGVGLSLARNIVEQHGGTIVVASEGVDMGSDFKVTLPLTSEANDAFTGASVTTSGDRRRIVVVDDQEDSREMLKLLLEARDHEVMDAADGPAALEVIKQMRPDVAFIDIGLPTMTGYEIAQRIRAQSDLDGVFLVALTGYGAPNDVLAVKQAGFDEHLIKPADLARIERILQRKPLAAHEVD
ncbi:MAG TPA: chemotaxis protein CheB [Kofleriaceae bacterium]|nr:chemotaxis protein CheB [Kofleriaceae bacterium]